MSIISFIPNDKGKCVPELTKSRAHPVGKKARIDTNRSDMVRPHTTNNTVITDTKPRNKSPLRILNIS